MGSWIYTQGNQLRRRRRFPPFIPAIHGKKEEEVERNILRQLMKNDVCGGRRRLCHRGREGGKEKLFAGAFFQKGKRKKGCCGRSDSQKKRSRGEEVGEWESTALPLYPNTNTRKRRRKTSRPPLVLRAPGSAGINPSLFFPSPKIDFNGLSPPFCSLRRFSPSVFFFFSFG